jgi:hypothetical protein
MASSNSPNWLAKAAKQLNHRESRHDGHRVAACLSSGLSIIGDSVYARIHYDMEEVRGVDSMLMSVSETKTKQQTTEEIEAYQVAEASSAARQFVYLKQPDDWCLEWLAQLRLGERGRDKRILERARAYFAESPETRSLAFSDGLVRVMPDSRRAPLVLFRLLPLAVQIATASAFVDHDTASDLRRQQTAILPPIADCQQCGGRLLEYVEQCRACGNPLWKYKWLTATD